MAMQHNVPAAGPGDNPEPATMRGSYAGIRAGLGGSRYVLRIGDAEREAAAEQLREHFVAGRLTLDELDERLGEIFTARTQDQLSRVMADLPSLGRRPVRARQHAVGETQHALPDRGSRYAALAMLLLAMLIWLFTAVLFLRHGYPQGYNHYWVPGHLHH
jgi:Domain of unknown function (DUF1707)